MRNFIVSIILNGRFSFKLNFNQGWNSTRFIPGWNSHVNRNFFIPRWVSFWDEVSSLLHVNALWVIQVCLTQSKNVKSVWFSLTLIENSSVVTMTPSNIRNIHTTGKSCRDALPCTNMALKLPQYFYLLMEKTLGYYFQVQSVYYQAVQCNQKNTYSCISRWQVRSEKVKKG